MTFLDGPYICPPFDTPVDYDSWNILYPFAGASSDDSDGQPRVQGTLLGEEMRVQSPDTSAMTMVHLEDGERTVVDSKKPPVQEWIGSNVNEENLHPSEETTTTPSFLVPQQMSQRDPQGATLSMVSSKSLQTDTHDHPLLLYSSPRPSPVNKVEDGRDEEDPPPSPIPTHPLVLPRNKNGSSPFTNNTAVVARSMVKTFPRKVAAVLHRTVAALSAKTSTNAPTT